ncbi:DNA repair protein rhp54 [Plakobranchus ocellatus]|uniref:DNA repair protein rhp54 n=1 Tax=Plakobranchus ocellatus TaxID=259542 RepID=A0AAV3ZDU6_9GAST|nr:DNA repair protein rhp54 [Plakobranchus ocellatus]
MSMKKWMFKIGKGMVVLADVDMDMIRQCFRKGSEDDLPLAKLTEKADEDDLPLSVIQSSLRLVIAMVATKNPPSEVDEPEKYSTDPISPQQAERVYHELTIVCDKTYSHSVSYCTHYQCCDEVFGACCSCLSFLCYDHFVNDSPCSMHTSCHNNKSFAHLLNQDSSLEIDDEAMQFDFMDETSFLDDTAKDPDFVQNYKEDSDDSVFDTNDSPVDENKITDEMRPEENKEIRTEDSRDPSAFPVEGEPRESVSESGTPRKRKRPKTDREIRKERRNKGCEYTT